MYVNIKNNISKKNRSVFEMIIISSILLCFLFITTGVIFNASKLTMGNDRNDIFIFCFTVFTGVFLMLFIFLIFKAVKRININRQFIVSIVLFAVYAGIMIWLVSIVDIHPKTDSYTDIDTGWYLSRNPLEMDNYHSRWLEIYPNNYMMILVFKWLANISNALDIPDHLFFLTIVNACILAGGLVLTFLTALSLWGIRTANRILLLMVLNPVYYYFTFWIYTSSFSIPLMMGIIYVIVRFDRAGTKKGKIITCVILGVLAGLGMLIRPTAVFPIVAYAVFVLIRLIRGEYGRPSSVWIFNLLCIALAAGCFIVVYKAGDMKIESVFGGFRSGNHPLFHWIYMGSHGNGNLSTLSEDTGIKVDLFDESTLIRGTVHNYKNAGPAGTADLWIRKMLTVFSDADANITDHTMIGNSFRGRTSELFEGFLFSVYSHAYRMVIYVGIILSCISLLRKKRTDDSVLYFLLVLFTGILFYFIWEAKGVYMLVFMPAMVLASEKGLGVIFEKHYSLGSERRVLTGLIAGALIVINTLVLWSVLSQTVDHAFVRINGDTYGRSDDKLEITANGDDGVVQSFVCSDPFNNILIRAGVPGDTGEISGHTIDIYDRDELILSKTVNKEDIIDDNISLDLDRTESGGDYMITIHKDDPSKGYMIFYTGKNYYLESYVGTLTAGGEKYTDDLSMIVQEKVRSEYLPVKSRLFVVGAMDIMCLSGLLGYCLSGRNKAADPSNEGR